MSGFQGNAYQGQLSPRKTAIASDVRIRLVRGYEGTGEGSSSIRWITLASWVLRSVRVNDSELGSRSDVAEIDVRSKRYKLYVWLGNDTPGQRLLHFNRSPLEGFPRGACRIYKSRTKDYPPGRLRWTLQSKMNAKAGQGGGSIEDGSLETSRCVPLGQNEPVSRT